MPATQENINKAAIEKDSLKESIFSKRNTNKMLPNDEDIKNNAQKADMGKEVNEAVTIGLIGASMGLIEGTVKHLDIKQ